MLFNFKEQEVLHVGLKRRTRGWQAATRQKRMKREIFKKYIAP
jgi:hypothetical protein